MRFARGDVVRCIDADAYARVEATLRCCNDTEFTNKSSLTDEENKRRLFVVVSAIEATKSPKRPELILLISISSGLPKVGEQKSMKIGVNYLSVGPERIPYKEGCYIVYGLGAVAKEADLERVFGKALPTGEIQSVSLMNTPHKLTHEAALTKCWKGKETIPAGKWYKATDAHATDEKKSPSKPELTPVK
jgi:hypothetical protein